VSNPALDGEPGEADAEGVAERRAAAVPTALHAQRIDKMLVEMAPEFSRSHLQHLLERGHVRLDGAVATASSKRLRAGQSVELELVPTAESRAFTPQAMTLDLLYEDHDLLVLNKPAGLVVHPAPGNWSGTLLNGLLAHHAVAAQLPRAGIVHRLDKDTSGVMMVGKSLAAVTALVRAMAAREVQRRYLAIVHGVTPNEVFTVDRPIGRDPVQRVRMAVVAGGRASRTDFERLAATQKFTALSCTLHSGRTHQIRVHLSASGFPLVADTLYGGKPALGLQRQALHATELGLQHPITGATLRFDCAAPADFQQAWTALAG